MHTTQPIPVSVRRLLGQQAGLITRTQAVGCGLSLKALERLVRDERWTRLAPGVFLRGVALPTFEQRMWLGVLLAGEPSAIGGAAALYARGVGLTPESITVVVPRSRRRQLPLEYELLRDAQHRLDHARGLLPLIRVEDALLDTVANRPLEAVVGAITDAVRLRLTTPRRIESVLFGRSHPHRAAELTAVLADLQGIESNLEFVFRRDVLRAHGLPEGRRQVSTRQGRRLDTLYEEFGVIVELDGRRGHLEGRFRDFARDNDHAASLLVTLRYGSADVRDTPCAIAGQLATALSLRGWQGQLSKCHRCPAR